VGTRLVLLTLGRAFEDPGDLGVQISPGADGCAKLGHCGRLVVDA
jgi:hypothetical protein